MKISAKGRYALRLMLDIALHNADGWVTLKEASERQGISIKYLEQVVALLTRANLLKSSRGPQGGYMLVKHPREYSVGEALRILSSTPTEKASALRSRFGAGSMRL